MSHSRKDKPGGHRKTEVNFGAREMGVVVWGESGKRYAKRLRGKLARRHNKVSIRDLEVIEPFDAWADLQEFYEDYYSDDYGYDDPWTDFCEPDDEPEYEPEYDDGWDCYGYDWQYYD